LEGKAMVPRAHIAILCTGLLLVSPVHADERSVGMRGRLLGEQGERPSPDELYRRLAGASDRELNALLRDADLAALLRVPALPSSTKGGVKRSRERKAALAKRQRVFDLLTRDRVGALGVEVRARLINALQRGETTAPEERAAAAILLAARGEDLSRLKDLVDGGGDRHDLSKLVYRDIGDGGLRRRVLEHIAREARSTGRVRVMSDIDDTLYANYKDRRYPKGTTYPGVLALHRELGGSGSRPVFITARPHDVAGKIDALTHRSLAAKGVKESTVLTGSFRSVVTTQRMAKEKLANFGRYRSLFPEHDYVWLGDSGQGDAAFGAAARAKDPKALRVSLIHAVVGSAAEQPQREGVFFFDTYVGAALHAHREGLLDRAALERVARAARADFDAIRFDSAAQEQAARAQLDRDLGSVRGLK
jgi:hypothetical protein